MLPPATLLLVLAACSDKSSVESPVNDDSAPINESEPTANPYGPDNAWYHADAEDVTVPDSTGWRRNQTPPDVHFVDQNGDEVWLYQFTGRPVFVDFFGEWCGPCNFDAPFLQRFWEEHEDDAVVLGVAETDQDYYAGDADTVARWVAAYGNTHPVVYAPPASRADIPNISSYPTITMLDPKMRVAQVDVQDLGDSWVSQFIDRMAFMIGGDLDNEEVCGDGIDNDLNAKADCMESACASDCAEQSVSGSFSPCAPGDTVTGDYYRVTVPDEVVTVEADTVSASSTFDVILRAIPEGGDWAYHTTVGDDELACAFPPATTACPQGWLRPGVWILGVMPANGDNNTGQCADPNLGEYILKIQGNATIELVDDDLTRPSQSGN